ncbi:MAG: DUF6265 family protein [Gammaproteobacteria bacterium]|nr:DUF6265 family protein [Gammaproteobacteria bacterium]
MSIRIPSWLFIALAALPVNASGMAAELPAELGFLSGCWRGEIGADGSRIVEQYGDVDGATLLGTLKTIRDDETVFFEFIRIHRDGPAVLLTPYPNGQAETVSFRLVELEPDKASFDNPEHDFPRRITYRLLPGGELLTRVAGVVGERTIVEEYRSLPVACTN